MNRTRQVNTSFTEAEYKLLQYEAEYHGYSSLASYCRDVVLTHGLKLAEYQAKFNATEDTL